MTPTMILDIVIVALLLPTIVFAVTLNSRLNALRKNKDQLGRLINSFNEATIRAEASIPKLKKTAEEAGQALHERVEKARALRDDLAFMVDRADSMAAKLEGTVRTARNEVKPTPAPKLTPARRTISSTTMPLGSGEEGEPDEDDRSEAERELLRALQSAR